MACIIRKTLHEQLYWHKNKAGVDALVALMNHKATFGKKGHLSVVADNLNAAFLSIGDDIADITIKETPLSTVNMYETYALIRKLVSQETDRVVSIVGQLWIKGFKILTDKHEIYDYLEVLAFQVYDALAPGQSTTMNNIIFSKSSDSRFFHMAFSSKYLLDESKKSSKGGIRCERCGVSLEKKDNETMEDYLKRKYCTRACYKLASAKTDTVFAELCYNKELLQADVINAFITWGYRATRDSVYLLCKNGIHKPETAKRVSYALWATYGIKTDYRLLMEPLNKFDPYDKSKFLYQNLEWIGDEGLHQQFEKEFFDAYGYVPDHRFFYPAMPLNHQTTRPI